MTIILLNLFQVGGQGEDSNVYSTYEGDLVKGGQLTDEHIHLTHQLLKKQFPHLDGLQSTLLSETDAFEALQHEGI